MDEVEPPPPHAKNLLKALKIFKSQYRELLLDCCDDVEIKGLCIHILNILKEKIDIKDSSESTLNICKLNCFVSTDVHP